MTPINNSDTAWLIVADYNQENDKFHEELREDVLEVNVNDWYFKSGSSARDVGGFSIGALVGDSMDWSSYVGSAGDHSVSGDAIDMSGMARGRLVGGNLMIRNPKGLQ